MVVPGLIRGRWRKIASPVVGAVLFIGAVWLLQNELRAYQFHDIYLALQEIPIPLIGLALALTAANFIILSGVDLLAVRYIRRELRYRQIFLASFSGFAISQSLGFPLITATTVRLRLYTRWGISPQEVTRILAFCGLSFFIGLFIVLGLVLIGSGSGAEEVVGIPDTPAKIIGVALIMTVGAYIAWNLTRSEPIRIGGWTFPAAPLRVVIPQIIVSALDWIFVAAIVYTLLPAGLLTYPAVIQIVVLAQLAGILSNVPGGLGVFEAVIFLLLPAGAPEDVVLASLLAYRGIYTLLPLIMALILLMINEMLGRTRPLRAGHRAIS